MSREPLDMDMGDDDQADDIIEYERNIEDPPADYVIRNREADADGFLGIGEELSEEWTERGERHEEMEEDERPAEEVAVRAFDEDSLDNADLDGDENLISGEGVADELDL
ncbi:hypothetical protein [Nocardia coubleae]|uniref:hypothetical protein n=1 Tax=Nocardia coubleae TaxID=356147 RepID=UPI000A66626E|nr:hypothetical protein [Nocardia coubleae]